SAARCGSPAAPPSDRTSSASSRQPASRNRLCHRCHSRIGTHPLSRRRAPSENRRVSAKRVMAWALLNQAGRRESMRGKILFAVALATGVGLCARNAHACGQGGSYAGAYTALAIGVLAVGALDVGLTLYDGGSAIAQHRQSTAYG